MASAGREELDTAIARGDLVEVARLLAAGADPNAVGADVRPGNAFTDKHCTRWDAFLLSTAAVSLQPSPAAVCHSH